MVSTDARIRAIEKEWAKHPPKRKSFAKSPRIIKSKTVSDLVKLDKKLTSEGTKTTGSIFKFDPKTRKKLNDIGWAIRNQR